MSTTTRPKRKRARRVVRRGDGEGSLVDRRESRGTFYAVVSRNGKREWVNLRTDSEKKARAILERLAADSDHSEMVAAWAHRYCEGDAAKRPAPSTLSNRARTWAALLEPEFGKLTFAELLTPGRIKAGFNRIAKRSLVGDPHHQPSQGYMLAGYLMLRAIVHLAEGDGVPGADLSMVVSRESVFGRHIERRERTLIPDGALRAMLRHPDVAGWFKVLCVAARTFGGLRGADAVALDWSFVDWQMDTLKVYRTKNKRTQTFAIPKTVRPYLRALWVATGRPDAGPMFPIVRGRAGERRGPTSFARDLQNALTKAGVVLSTPTFHGFRRTFCTLAVGKLPLYLVNTYRGDSAREVLRTVELYIVAGERVEHSPDGLLTLPDALVPELPSVRDALADLLLTADVDENNVIPMRKRNV